MSDVFFAAGWTKADLIDAIVVTGDKTATNHLHGITRAPVDFPAAPEFPGWLWTSGAMR